MNDRPASVAEAILRRLQVPPLDEYRFFLPEDLRDLAPVTALRMALSRLVSWGQLRRVTTGIYTRSSFEVDGELEWVDAIALTLARRSACRILTAGRRTAVSMCLPIPQTRKHIYLSDGGSTKLRWVGHEIEIKRVKPSLFAAGCGEIGDLIQAAFWMGPSADPIAMQRAVRQPSRGTGPAITGKLPSQLPRWVLETVRTLADARHTDLAQERRSCW